MGKNTTGITKRRTYSLAKRAGAVAEAATVTKELARWASNYLGNSEYYPHTKTFTGQALFALAEGKRKEAFTLMYAHFLAELYEHVFSKGERIHPSLKMKEYISLAHDESLREYEKYKKLN